MGFPNQVDRVVLSLEQAECLTSHIRSEVFWAFSMTIAFSVAQVAKALGKSPQTIHYHVKELIQVGLLIPAGSRQNRSRTEILYIHAGRTTVDQGRDGSAEYNALRAKSFRFTANRLVHETEGFYEAAELNVDHFEQSAFLRGNVNLTVEQSLRLRERLREILRDIQSETVQEGSARIHVMLYARPTVGQSKAWIAEAKGIAKQGDPDEDPV